MPSRTLVKIVVTACCLPVLGCHGYQLSTHHDHITIYSSIPTDTPRVTLSSHTFTSPAIPESDMPTGQVRLFHERKSYGFIERDGPYADVFFHISDIEGEPPERDTPVEFELRYGDRGPRAVEVERCDGDS